MPRARSSSWALRPKSSAQRQSCSRVDRAIDEKIRRDCGWPGRRLRNMVARSGRHQEGKACRKRTSGKLSRNTFKTGTKLCIMTIEHVDPPHPGEFIREVYLDPLEVSSRTVAAKLKVSPSTLTRLLNGQSASRRRWPCACPRPWAGRRKAGWRCKIATTSGRCDSISMSIRLRSLSLRLDRGCTSFLCGAILRSSTRTQTATTP